MILVSGEALIDLIPVADEDGRYDAVRGGSPYNVAIGLARLGAPTAFVSRISADANGEGLAAALAADGVDLSLAERDKQPTTLAFVMRGTAQDRLALFVLSRRHQLRRRLAVPGDLAGQGAPSARRLDLRRRPASRRAGGRARSPAPKAR